MPNLITQARLRKGIPSNDALAKILIEVCPELQAHKPRSLSAKIGLLDKGDLGWWKGRPKCAEALAAVLALDIGDLGLHDEVSHQALVFLDFPEFPPVDLALEELPVLGKTRRVNGTKTGRLPDSDEISDWLPSEVLPSHLRVIPPCDITWLEITDEFCKEMLIAQLRARGKWEVLQVEDLASVSGRLKRPVPVVLNLRRKLAGEELLPLRALDEYGAVLIIASYPPPQRPESRHGDDAECWEAVHTTREERAILSLTSKFGFWRGVKHFSWHLNDDWQTRLMTWVEERIARLKVDSLFVANEILNWLGSFDANRMIFRQVSDVLMLAQFCHHQGGKILPKSAQLDAGAKLLGKLRPYLNSRDSDILKRLTWARWVSMDFPWNGALSWEVWRHLVTTKEDHSNLQLLTIEELQIAAESCIIKENANGLYEFAGPLRASLFARDLVKDAITTGKTDLWGAAVFDEARREIVDSVVNALTTAELAAAVDLLDTTDPWAPASIGAEETLFLTLSRAAWRGELEQNTVDRIVKAVWARGGMSENLDMPQLWSRHYSYSDALGSWRWMQTCWFWSVGTQRPASLEIGEGAAGYFPDWADAATWPPSLPSREKGIMQASPSAEWKDFMRLAGDLAHKFSPPEVFNDFSEESNHPLFALALAWEGKWAPQAKWWKHVIHNEWAEELLLHTVSVHGGEAAAWLWPSLIESLANDIDGRFQPLCWSKVWRWFISTLTPEAIVENRSFRETAYLCACARHLPPDLRVYLLETIPIDLGTRMESHIGTLIEWCPENRCDAMLPWQDLILLVYRITVRIWQAAPRYAFALLDRDHGPTPYLSYSLIDNVPAEHVAELASLLCRRPDLLDPQERIHWVKQHLSASGRNAARILSVVRDGMEISKL